MPRQHRLQKTENIDVSDTRPLVARPLARRADPMRNPKDLDPEVAVEHDHLEHGGTQETRAETLATRGTGGRKRSGAAGRHRVGRDISKRR